MADSKSKSLRERIHDDIDVDERKKSLIEEIKQDYQKHGEHQTLKVETRNILLIGRSRTGKSTIKSLFVDPTVVTEELSLKSDSRDPLFESFHIGDKKLVLNIIDTPGLYERGVEKDKIRDNETIMKAIKICANREITKFHCVCFCISLVSGINEEDIKSLVALRDFLGHDLSKNSCLIITHCESKTIGQREKLRGELKNDAFFKDIAHFFEKGIYFAGTINRDDYDAANESIMKQYVTISEYRKTLIDLFESEIEPYQINMEVLKKLENTDRLKAEQLEHMNKILDEQTALIAEINSAKQDGTKLPKVVEQVVDSIEKLESERKNFEKLKKMDDSCQPS